MENWKTRIEFILMEPKEPGNIGASARAIKNMGFLNLGIVKPLNKMNDEGRWFARNAHDVLDSAAVYPSFDEAIRGKALVVGTTRRVGKRRGVIATVEQGARRVYDAASAGNRIAVLFGREARGLFNEEVEECGLMLTIPSSAMQPSLNLAQAVLLIAYELSKAEFTVPGRLPDTPPDPLHPSPYPSSDALVSHESLMKLYERIPAVLELLEYIPHGDRNIEKKILANLKHFIGRAGLTEWELKMLHGLCWQVEKKLGKR